MCLAHITELEPGLQLMCIWVHLHHVFLQIMAWEGVLVSASFLLIKEDQALNLAFKHSDVCLALTRYDKPLCVCWYSGNCWLFQPVFSGILVEISAIFAFLT